MIRLAVLKAIYCLVRVSGSYFSFHCDILPASDHLIHGYIETHKLLIYWYLALGHWPASCRREESVHELSVLPLPSPLVSSQFSSAPSSTSLSSSVLTPLIGFPCLALLHSSILLCPPRLPSLVLCIHWHCPLFRPNVLQLAYGSTYRDSDGRAAEAEGLTRAGAMQGRKVAAVVHCRACCSTLSQLNDAAKFGAVATLHSVISTTVCKNDWDEATWVISLDDLNCFSKGRRGGKRSKQWYIHF